MKKKITILGLLVIVITGWIYIKRNSHTRNQFLDSAKSEVKQLSENNELKNADQILNEASLKKMKDVGEQLKGKNYDLTFEWSDDKIYCSELIWKIYQRSTGIEIGKLQKLSDFDLTNASVKKIMKERYGDKIPTQETVISPIAIFESNYLMTIKSN